jgi:FixJ family two-component response regulator
MRWTGRLARAARIKALSNQVHQESRAVRIDIRREGIDRRVVCEVQGFQHSPLVGFVESKAIARELDVSHRTIEAHRQNLLRKVGLSSVKELLALALASGREH